MELTVQLAIEKVLFRLAVLEGGRVALARAFLELPLAIEVVEAEADKVADGSAFFKDEWGEFLSFDFPELKNAGNIVVPHDCPTCGRAAPESTRPPEPVPSPDDSKPAKRQTIPGSLVCDTCYRKVGRAANHTDAGALERLKHYWKGEDEEDPVKVALVEHEIFYHALRLGGQALTHTAIAAQTRLPSAQVKARLQRLAQRRYIREDLVGDAMVYRFPVELTYPEPHFRRSQGGLAWTEEAPAAKSGPLKNLLGAGLAIRAKPSDSRPVELARPSEPASRMEFSLNDPPPAASPSPSPPPPVETPPPRLNIKVKDTRKRGTPRPPAP